MSSSKPPIIALSPMAGITDWPMRALCRRMGCAHTTTEMVSAMGYLTAPQSLHVYRFLLDTGPFGERPAVQIFGHDAASMANAAAQLTQLNRFSGIDINMGCPAQKVTSSGSGSALMKNLPLCARIIQSVRAATPLPLTVKMRLGWDEAHINAAELAHIAQECGADGVTVHGRTRVQQYAGRADWDAIGRVKASVRIPVMLNGDIFTAQNALAALQLTGCDGVAIGRGALGNPFVFSQIRAALESADMPPPGRQLIADTAIRHADMMRQWKGERSAVLEMRKHLCWYIKGVKGASRLRAQINASPNLDEVLDMLRAFADEDGEGQ